MTRAKSLAGWVEGGWKERNGSKFRVGSLSQSCPSDHVASRANAFTFSLRPIPPFPINNGTRASTNQPTASVIYQRVYTTTLINTSRHSQQRIDSIDTIVSIQGISFWH
jgi:hypothetical protein